jgi:hypothetical protein
MTHPFAAESSNGYTSQIHDLNRDRAAAHMTQEIAKAIERRPAKIQGTTGRGLTAPLTKCCDGMLEH